MEVLRHILVKKVLKAYHKTVDSIRNSNSGVYAAASNQILCVIVMKIA